MDKKRDDKRNKCITCGSPCHNKQCQACYNSNTYKGKVGRLYTARKYRANHRGE